MKQRPLLLVWDRIGDYHRARVEALRQQAGPRLVLTADRGSADKLYGWENTGQSALHVVLSKEPVDQPDLVGRVRAFWKLLREHSIEDVVLAGYGNLDYLAFILAAWVRGCRVVLFAESWYPGKLWMDRLKGWLLTATCDGLFVSGKRAERHFRERLGVRGLRLEPGYSVVDNRHFRPRTDAIRERLLLSVARFSPEKDLATLIRAFRGSRLADSWRLRLIGGGPLEQSLRELAEGCPAIEFAGWVGYADLPAEYARSAWFVLPSQFEPWGLVVNEAMAAGLPVIASDACGCQPDLISDENGHTFTAGDVDGLREILNGLAEPDAPGWQRRSRASLDRIEAFSCDAWARRLLQLLS